MLAIVGIIRRSRPRDTLSSLVSDIVKICQVARLLMDTVGLWSTFVEFVSNARPAAGYRGCGTPMTARG